MVIVMQFLHIPLQTVTYCNIQRDLKRMADSWWALQIASQINLGRIFFRPKLMLSYLECILDFFRPSELLEVEWRKNTYPYLQWSRMVEQRILVRAVLSPVTVGCALKLNHEQMSESPATVYRTVTVFLTHWRRYGWGSYSERLDSKGASMFRRRAIDVEQRALGLRKRVIDIEQRESRSTVRSQTPSGERPDSEDGPQLSCNERSDLEDTIWISRSLSTD